MLGCVLTGAKFKMSNQLVWVCNDKMCPIAKGVPEDNVQCTAKDKAS